MTSTTRFKKLSALSQFEIRAQKTFQKLKLPKKMRHMYKIWPQFKAEEVKNNPGAKRLFWKGQQLLETLSYDELSKQAKNHNHRCFIIGGGPSVRKVHWGPLQGEFLWALNASSTLFFDQQAPLNMASIIDPDFVTQHPELFIKLMQSNLLLSLDLRLLRHAAEYDLLKNNQKIIYTQNIYEPYGQNALNPRELVELAKTNSDIILPEDKTPFLIDKPILHNTRAGFVKNVQLGFLQSTVAMLALQLAYYVGFKEVYLLGIDMNNFGKHFFEDKTRPSWLESDYAGNILPSFQVVSDICKQEDFKVFNCSPSSSVPEEVLPKLSLNSLPFLQSEMNI